MATHAVPMEISVEDDDSSSYSSVCAPEYSPLSPQSTTCVEKELHEENNMDIDDIDLSSLFLNSSPNDALFPVDDQPSINNFRLVPSSTHQNQTVSSLSTNNDISSQSESHGVTQSTNEHETTCQSNGCSASQSVIPHTKEWYGFKLVGDNLDKTINPRIMRSDHQRSSLHYFHCFAVRDRINLSNFSDIPPVISSLSIDDTLSKLIPTNDDQRALQHNFKVIMSQILVEEIPFFKTTFNDVIIHHIDHKYSGEMAKKSVVVPLGVIFKNEMVNEEMVDIVTHLQKYIPSISTTHEYKIVSTGETLPVQSEQLHQILLGGDQLTAARVRSCKMIRANSETPLERLEGVIPVAEDWHTGVIILEVSIAFSVY